MLIHVPFFGQVYQFVRRMSNLLALLFLLDQTRTDLPLSFFVEENVTQVDRCLEGVPINDLFFIELGSPFLIRWNHDSFRIPTPGLNKLSPRSGIQVSSPFLQIFR